MGPLLLDCRDSWGGEQKASSVASRVWELKAMASYQPVWMFSSILTVRTNILFDIH